MAYDISVVKCIWCLDRVKIILESACRDSRLIDTMHITSCRNVISIKHSANAVLVAFWLFSAVYKNEQFDYHLGTGKGQ